MFLILVEEERRKQAWASTGRSFQSKTSPPNLCSLRLETHLYFKNINQVKPFDSLGWQNLSRAIAEEEAFPYSSLDESRRQNNKEFTHRSHFLWKQVDHRDVERFVLIVTNLSRMYILLQKPAATPASELLLPLSLHSFVDTGKCCTGILIRWRMFPQIDVSSSQAGMLRMRFQPLRGHFSKTWKMEDFFLRST